MLAETTGGPGTGDAVRAENEAYMRSLSPADRQRVIRGEALRGSRRPFNRLIRDVSSEVVGLHVLLCRPENGGSVSIAELAGGSHLGVWVDAAVAELEELALAERVGSGISAAVRLLPGAERVVLMSSWSMRG